MPCLDAFMKRVEEVMSGGRAGQLKAGDHCRWCPAKADCPELRGHTLVLAKEEFAEADMTPEKAAEVLSMAPAIKTYVEAVTKWTHGQLDKGVAIPGYKLVQTYGNRRSRVDEELIVRRCRTKKFGKKLIYDTKLKSPAQLEKVVGKELVEEFVEKPLRGTTVVPAADGRKAVDRKPAAEEFANG